MHALHRSYYPESMSSRPPKRPRATGLTDALHWILGESKVDALMEEYGDGTLAAIQQNPYQPLIDGVGGIGIKTCDRVADALSIPRTSPVRFSGLIYEALHTSERNGHCGQTLVSLENSVCRGSKDNARLFADCMQMLTDKAALQTCTINGIRYVLRRCLFLAESGIASALTRLMRTRPPWTLRKTPRSTIHDVGVTLGVKPSPSQMDALELALTSNVVVISGGAGTGKTTLMNMLLLAILDSMPDHALDIRLVAPTGLAADRLTQVTKREAMTIHRSLKTGWDKDRHHLLILDEATMAGSVLCQSLLNSLPPRCAVVFVGDEGQLCPVDPGAVFHSLLRCPVIPSCTLREVHRQAERSSIPPLARCIREGNLPDMQHIRDAGGDVEFIDAVTVEQCTEELRRVVCEHLPSQGYGPSDIQALCLQNPGPIGVRQINQCMQRWLNSDAPEVQIKGVCYRVGDRLLHTKNDYDRRIMNGNIGTLCGVEGGLLVKFGDRTIVFAGEVVNNLTLAYCLSVHKSQGSEFKVVVLVMLAQGGACNRQLLKRNLLYTAVTRATQKLVIISNESTLAQAINRTEPRLCGPSVVQELLCRQDRGTKAHETAVGTDEARCE